MHPIYLTFNIGQSAACHLTLRKVSSPIQVPIGNPIKNKHPIMVDINLSISLPFSTSY